ncbi:DUF5344 family protein [Metabacillus fastidiosus]|uniref:DUF5344 family protein n=1 Tax=Metabacillus fastidiosus TaxID=1458 RepID=UPI003D27CEAD
MSTTIKIEYAEVEASLTKLKSSTNLLNAPLNEIEGGKNLETLKKLQELNEELQKLSTSYKTLLIANIGSTQKSISSLKEADETLASSIKN